jgi:hypothetical protein
MWTWRCHINLRLLKNSQCYRYYWVGVLCINWIWRSHFSIEGNRYLGLTWLHTKYCNMRTQRLHLIVKISSVGLKQIASIWKLHVVDRTSVAMQRNANLQTRHLFLFVLVVGIFLLIRCLFFVLFMSFYFKCLSLKKVIFKRKMLHEKIWFGWKLDTYLLPITPWSRRAATRVFHFCLSLAPFWRTFLLYFSSFICPSPGDFWPSFVFPPLMSRRGRGPFH